MKLYRIKFGHKEYSLEDELQPYIPPLGMVGEDATIQRICVAPSLDDCLTGYGIYIIGVKGFEKALDANSGVSLEKASVRFPITILTFEVADGCSYVLPPETIARFVPDAIVTKEHWITKAIKPVSVRHMWLFDASIEEKQVLLRNGIFKYFKVTQSRWSNVERKPNSAFKKQMLLAMGKMYT